MGIIERFRDSIPAYRQAQFSKIVDQPNNPAQQSPPPADTFAVLLRRIPCKGTPICSIRDATPCARLLFQSAVAGCWPTASAAYDSPPWRAYTL
jgi:hypothetical protein